MMLEFIDGLGPRTTRVLECFVEFSYWVYSVLWPACVFVYSGSFWMLAWALLYGNLMARGAFAPRGLDERDHS